MFFETWARVTRTKHDLKLHDGFDVLRFDVHMMRQDDCEVPPPRGGEITSGYEVTRQYVCLMRFKTLKVDRVLEHRRER